MLGLRYLQHVDAVYPEWLVHTMREERQTGRDGDREAETERDRWRHRQAEERDLFQ